jgi:ABC-type branched-subunit amino acid transport system substrate-binding protein
MATNFGQLFQIAAMGGVGDWNMASSTRSRAAAPMVSCASQLAVSSTCLLLPIAADAQVKIGVGAPISGPRAAFGMQIRMGIEQAIEDIKARGGVLGKKLLPEMHWHPAGLSRLSAPSL